jgi:hypothetical protein
MGEPSRYWNVEFFRTGQIRKSEGSPEARRFFQEHFPEFVGQSKVPDRKIQRRLINWVKSGEEAEQQMAEFCLRCYTVNAIEWHCLRFVNKFNQVDFDALINRVLHNEFIAEVVASFDPEKSALSTWTNQKIFSNKEVKRFLRFDYEIIMERDWFILCDTSVAKLKRLLEAERTAYEARRGSELLQVFKEVYCGQLRAEREKLKQKNQKSRRPYPDPTQEQLIQMALRLSPNSPPGSEDVLNQLKELAKVLRIHRAQPPVPRSARSDQQQPEEDLLADYRSPCVAKAVNEVIEARLHNLNQGKKGQKKVEQYLNALGLFYCQGIPMKDIALAVGLGDQPSVSKLLDRNTLKADISRHMVMCMRGCLDAKLGNKFSSPEELKAWDENVSDFLEKDVEKLMQADAREGFTSQNRQMQTVLAQEICRCVQAVCRQCLKVACQCSSSRRKDDE